MEINVVFFFLFYMMPDPVSHCESIVCKGVPNCHTAVLGHPGIFCHPEVFVDLRNLSS